MTTRRFLAVAWASSVAGWVVAGVAVALTQTPASIRVAREMLVKPDMVVVFLKLSSQGFCADSRIVYGTARCHGWGRGSWNVGMGDRVLVFFYFQKA
jgi:hypothetical protein